MYDIALFHKKLFSFGTYGFYYRIGEEFFLVQAFYALVQINACCLAISVMHSRNTGLGLVPGSPGILPLRPPRGTQGLQ